LGPLKAVLLDVYGTLLISASGDVSLAEADSRAAALVAAFQAVGCPLQTDGQAAWQLFRAAIDAAHQQARAAGIDYPEVEIREIWRSVLGELAARGWTSGAGHDIDLQVLAVEYELRANPVWPMPHAAQTLQTLRGAGQILGLISNAQFFTPETFPALWGRSPEELGFDRRLQFYSYELGYAKPSLRLYQLAAEALLRRGVEPGQVLYVGNDMRNDVQPAARIGFRTALFAGDARSLRLRAKDPALAGLVPEVVVTDLRHLVDCL
jgi:putative hydrolase of the HAD superfamily